MTSLELASSFNFERVSAGFVIILHSTSAHPRCIAQFSLRQEHRFDLRPFVGVHDRPQLARKCWFLYFIDRLQDGRNLQRTTAPAEPARPETRHARYPRQLACCAATHSSAVREPQLRPASSVKMQHLFARDPQSKHPGLARVDWLDWMRARSTGGSASSSTSSAARRGRGVADPTKLDWGWSDGCATGNLLSSNTAHWLPCLSPAVQISAADDACPRTRTQARGPALRLGPVQFLPA